MFDCRNKLAMCWKRRREGLSAGLLALVGVHCGFSMMYFFASRKTKSLNRAMAWPRIDE